MAVPPDHERYCPVSRGPHAGAPCNSCHASAPTPRLVRCTGYRAPMRSSSSSSMDGACRAAASRASAANPEELRDRPDFSQQRADRVHGPIRRTADGSMRHLVAESASGVVDIAGGRACLTPGEAAGVAVGSVVVFVVDAIAWFGPRASTRSSE